MLGFRKQGFKFSPWLPLQIGLILLFGILSLAACQPKPTPTESTAVGGTPTSSPTATQPLAVQSTGALTGVPYPQPTQAGSNAYPNPQQGAPPTPAGAYPGPQAGGVPTAAGAYPAPGSGASQPQATQGPYPDPANNPTSAYPPPAATSGANPSTPYPAPGASPSPGLPTSTATPPPTTTSAPQMTEVAPTNTPTPTPTNPAVTSPTATLIPTIASTPTATPVPSLRTDLMATDPSTVKLASGKPELIVFFAYWDGNSRIMMPVLLNLQDQYGSRVNFVYLDQDNPATSQLKRALYFEAYSILPQTFLLDANGKILRKWKGVIQQADLTEALQTASGS